MRLLFEMDKKDYEHCTHRFVRNSARSIIIRDGKIAMIHSLKYDYYKDNYYYLCEAEPEAVRQNLDAYEAQETYTLEYVTPLMAIQKNRSVGASPYNPMMFEREARVLELLISEKHFQ